MSRKREVGLEENIYFSALFIGYAERSIHRHSLDTDNFSEYLVAHDAVTYCLKAYNDGQDWNYPCLEPVERFEDEVCQKLGEWMAENEDPQNGFPSIECFMEQLEILNGYYWGWGPQKSNQDDFGPSM